MSIYGKAVKKIRDHIFPDLVLDQGKDMVFRKIRFVLQVVEAYKPQHITSRNTDYNVPKLHKIKKKIIHSKLLNFKSLVSWTRTLSLQLFIGGFLPEEKEIKDCLFLQRAVDRSLHTDSQMDFSHTHASSINRSFKNLLPINHICGHQTLIQSFSLSSTKNPDFLLVEFQNPDFVAST